MSLKRVRGRPMFFLFVICLIFIRHQPFLYLITALSGFSAYIGTVSAPIITSGIFVIKYYAEIYGFLSLFPDVGYALGGPLTAPAYDMTGSYNIAWIIAVILSVIIAVFLLYFYRGSHICIRGQEETGNTAKIQYNNGKMH